MLSPIVQTRPSPSLQVLPTNNIPRQVPGPADCLDGRAFELLFWVRSWAIALVAIRAAETATATAHAHNIADNFTRNLHIHRS
jgi:hypothetical protein